MDYLELYLHPSVHVFVFDGWIQFIPTDTEKNLMDPSRMEFPLNYFYPSYTKYRQQLMFGLTIFLTFSILLGFYLLWNTEGSKWWWWWVRLHVGSMSSLTPQPTANHSHFKQQHKSQVRKSRRKTYISFTRFYVDNHDNDNNICKLWALNSNDQQPSIFNCFCEMTSDHHLSVDSEARIF